MASISETPRGHHRQMTKLQEQVDYIRHKNDRKMNLLKVLNSLSDVNASVFEEYLHSNYTISTGVRSSYLRNDGPYQHRLVTGLTESRDVSYSGSTTRHKC